MLWYVKIIIYGDKVFIFNVVNALHVMVSPLCVLTTLLYAVVKSLYDVVSYSHNVVTFLYGVLISLYPVVTLYHEVVKWFSQRLNKIQLWVYLCFKWVHHIISVYTDITIAYKDIPKYIIVNWPLGSYGFPYTRKTFHYI